MTSEEYQNGLQIIYMIAVTAGRLDIPAMLAAIEYAETSAPIVDPTTWIRKSQRMQEDKELLRSILPLHELARKNMPQAADAPRVIA